MSYTKGVWKVVKNLATDSLAIDTEDSRIAKLTFNYPNKEANAKRIVHCVNNHEKLLAALKAISKCKRGEQLPPLVVMEMMEAIQSAERKQ